MNCYEFQDTISSYIEKELNLSEVEQFDRHLESCSECRDAYKGVASVIGALRISNRFSLPDSFDKRLKSRLERIGSKSTGRFSRYFEEGRILGFQPKYALASAAVVVVLVFLFVGLFPEGDGVPSHSPVPLSTQQQVPSTGAPPAQLAIDSNNDSTEADTEVQKSKPAFEGRIKLVKDRQ